MSGIGPTIADPYKDFLIRTFDDPATGNRLPYNLFLPSGSSDSQKYPLVVFMHDAGNLSSDPRQALRQGRGGTVWASVSDQLKRPAIVLAPQYASKVVDDHDGHVVTTMLETTVRLIRDVADRFHVDRDRIYATGQSMGGMMAMVISSRHPDLFAASFLVACQWDARDVDPLVHHNLWVVVSGGDKKAFPGQNAIIARLRERDADVACDTWVGSSAPEFEQQVTRITIRKAPINYVVLDRDSLLPSSRREDALAHHERTWEVAYDIEGIRAWLFEQRRR